MAEVVSDSGASAAVFIVIVVNGGLRASRET